MKPQGFSSAHISDASDSYGSEYYDIVYVNEEDAIVGCMNYKVLKPPFRNGAVEGAEKCVVFREDMTRLCTDT